MGKIAIGVLGFSVFCLAAVSCGDSGKDPVDTGELETESESESASDTASETEEDTESETEDTADSDSESESESEELESDTTDEESDSTPGETDSDTDDVDTGDGGPEDSEDSEDSEDPGTCLITDTDPDFVTEIGCRKDYETVASMPLTAGIPGALSAKTVIDRVDQNNLYFQNSRRYPIHYDFASTHLSGDGLPIITDLASFNTREYYAPDRRFILGALNYYEGPREWVYEIAPYDTADAAMIETAFDLIKEQIWVGDKLKFHPTSDNVTAQADLLPQDIPIITTEELFEGITYQPLNLATAMGQLRFFSTADLDTKYLSFRDIAVLETIPNDIGVCSGTISAEFQTPLAHINVLAQNRGTPNMGLKGAFDDPELRALDGKWVSLTVGAQSFEIKEVDKETADSWWETHKPSEVLLPTIDLSVTDLTDIEDVLDIENLGLKDALAKAIPAFGGKASHYGGFPYITSSAIPYPPAFVIPIAHYVDFMETNGFADRIHDLLADEAFLNDPAVREQELDMLQADIKSTPLDPVLEAEVIAKLNADFPGERMRFRSSTNCEDLGGFTGAGLYDSQSGDPNDPTRPVADAIRTVWAAVWGFRAFEEREYRSIVHEDVGMSVLVHRSFPDEQVTGVAISANIFDTAGLEPGYYINAQAGDVSVVLPPEGVTSDQFVYHYDMPNQPIVYYSHSNLVPEGETVMNRDQVAALGQAIKAIHSFFNPVYGPYTPEHFYAMDIEFKFNTDDTDPDAVPELVIKQARPYPGRGQGN